MTQPIESIAVAVVPGFVALERHPSVEVRTRAVEVLARRCDAFVKPTRDGQRRAGLAIYFPLAAAQ